MIHNRGFFDNGQVPAVFPGVSLLRFAFCCLPLFFPARYLPLGSCCCCRFLLHSELRRLLCRGSECTYIPCRVPPCFPHTPFWLQIWSDLMSSSPTTQIKISSVLIVLSPSVSLSPSASANTGLCTSGPASPARLFVIFVFVCHLFAYFSFFVRLFCWRFYLCLP